MKLRNQKLLSILLAATLTVSPVISVNAECTEEAAQETFEAAEFLDMQEENTADTLGEAEKSTAEAFDAADTEEAAEFIGEEGDFFGTDSSEDVLFGDDADDANEKIAHVEELIGALPVLADVTEEHREAIEEALAAYNALSEAEKTVVNETMGNKSSQPYGRDLETAVWGLEVLKTVDNSTFLPDGTYDASSTPALASEYSKGLSNSSRQKAWSLKDVTVKDGKATATVMVESGTYTAIRTNGTSYPVTSTDGKKFSEFANVPVELNGTMYLAATSSSMKGEIAFTITNTIEEPRYTAIPTESITNNTGMFKAVDAYILEIGGNKTLYLTLNSDGYRELFKGTYDEAVATGSDSAQWIIGTVRADGKGFDGKYQFAIPVSDSDSFIQLQALSNNHKKDGWWWYPRYIRLNQSAMTLETGDYKETFDLAVTNNVKMFSVQGADLTITGGPHSNSYKITSNVTMGSTSFDKAYIGSAAAAEAAENGIITLTEDRKFGFTVETIKGAGTAATIDTIIGTPTVIAFHSVKNDCWYERVFTFDKNAKALTINDSEKADYTAVDAAIAKIPADLSVYTEETAEAVTAAKNAVKTGLYASQQSEVDAMAKAVEDAVAALKEKPAVHTHSYGEWKTVSAATVFAPEVQERTCSCGEKETRNVGKALTPTAKLNAKSIALKVKQSTTKVKISGLANGDSVKSWKSSNTKVVKVNKTTGKIVAQKKTGKATITATLASGKNVNLKVTVQKTAVKTKKISGISSKIKLKKGAKAALKPQILPITSLEKVTYTSSNKKVATVSSKGTITAKKKGNATITVKSGKKKVTCKVTVK